MPVIRLAWNLMKGKSFDNRFNTYKLDTNVLDEINLYLQEKQIEVNVVEQRIKIDKVDLKKASDNNISVGKMALIDALVEADSNLNINELSTLSIAELMKLIEKYNILDELNYTSNEDKVNDESLNSTVAEDVSDDKKEDSAIGKSEEDNDDLDEIDEDDVDDEDSDNYKEDDRDDDEENDVENDDDDHKIKTVKNKDSADEDRDDDKDDEDDDRHNVKIYNSSSNKKIVKVNQ